MATQAGGDQTQDVAPARRDGRPAPASTWSPWSVRRDQVDRGRRGVQAVQLVAGRTRRCSPVTQASRNSAEGDHRTVEQLPEARQSCRLAVRSSTAPRRSATGQRRGSRRRRRTGTAASTPRNEPVVGPDQRCRPPNRGSPAATASHPNADGAPSGAGGRGDDGACAGPVR